MQILTAIPRDGLTADQVRSVLAASHVTVDVGADLLDAAGVFIEDISTDVELGGHVEHGSFRTVHRTCKVRMTRELDWGAVRLRLKMTVTAGGVTVPAYIGVFLLETPTTASGWSPRTWEVEGYDLLGGLAVQVGETYRVAAGSTVTDAVTQAVVDSGLSATVTLADSGTAPTLPTDMVWSVRDDVTWLRVVNDLLAAGGYRAVWADAGGRLRSEPYQPPSERPSEWTYDTSTDDTVVAPELEVTSDLWAAPNRWVFYVDDPQQGNPVEGVTQYTVVNQAAGPTSVDRRGRMITRKVPLSAADYASLVSQGDRIAEGDRRVSTEVEFSVGPNPLHGHFDVVTLIDAEAALSGRWQVSSWRLPLDGGDMTLTARQI